MKKLYILLLAFASVFLVACGAAPQVSAQPAPAGKETGAAVKNEKYLKITPEEAKDLIGKEGVVLLDVRTEEEYGQGYIPGAVLLPVDEISKKAAEVLKDKGETIIVYCRTGRRSANASGELADMGYTKVYDLGGIVSWPYETAKK